MQEILPKPPSEPSPADPLISGLWPPKPQESSLLMFYASWFVVLCYRSRWKLYSKSSEGLDIPLALTALPWAPLPSLPPHPSITSLPEASDQASDPSHVT